MLVLGRNFLIIGLVIFLSYQAYLIYLGAVFDAVSIQVSPGIISNNVKRGEIFSLNSSFDVRTRSHCSSNCSVNAISFDNRILYEDSFFVNDIYSGKISLNDSINLPGYGRSLYDISFKCTPLQSKGCDDISQSNSIKSIFSMNYAPNEKDLIFIDKTKNSFLTFRESFWKSEKNFNFLLKSNELDKIEFEDLDEFIFLKNHSLKKSMSVITSFFEIWKTQNVNELDKSFNKNEFSNQIFLENSLNNKVVEIDNKLKLHNNSINYLKLILNKKSFLETFYTNMIFLDNYSYWKNSFNDFDNRLNLDVDDLNAGDVYNYDVLYSDVFNLYNMTILFENALNNTSYNYKEFISDYSFLSKNKSILNLSKNNSTYWFDVACNLPNEFEFNLSNINNSVNKSINDVNAFFNKCNFRKQGYLIPELKAEFIKLNVSYIRSNINLPEINNYCCENNACYVCKDSKIPVIFVHGHSFNDRNSPLFNSNIFVKIIKLLEKKGFYDGGFGFIEKNNDAIFLGYDKQTMFRYSYYLDDSEESLLISNKEHIDVYSDRLNNYLNYVSSITGSKKIIIVAHSMGGLVVRDYINKYGSDNIHKLIMIGTPNKGITNGVYSKCPILGAKKECDDMWLNSKFIEQLNKNIPKSLPENVVIIAGKGCDVDGFDGDGVVALKNTLLDDVKSYVIKGSCGHLPNMHSDLLNPSIYPEAIDILVREISE